MQIVVNPCYVEGTVLIPASKSMMQRACAAALLHKGKTIIHNAGNSDDDQTAMDIVQSLGSYVHRTEPNLVIIESNGKPEKIFRLSCGESGLATRLFVPIAALTSDRFTVEGKASLLQRDMTGFENYFSQLGVAVRSSDGRLPLTVSGLIQIKNVCIDGSLSSQYLTGLLFALAHVATCPLEIKVSNLTSKPYVDVTLEVLEHFGYKIQQYNYNSFTILPSSREKQLIEIRLESDWSSAAYWMVAAAINGNLSIGYLESKSSQADRKILEILHQTGCEVVAKDNMFQVQRGALRGFTTDLTDAPDLFPVTAVLAAFCKTSSRLKGLNRLRHKESNRKTTISTMLRNFGVSHSFDGDVLQINGGEKIQGATIDSSGDHRIAMAAAIAALGANGATTIVGAEVISKSYPNFFRHAASLGVKLCAV